MRKIILTIIFVYQKISRLIWLIRPPFLIYSQCRFYPTCSEYAREALEKYGPSHGSMKSIKRLCRCHPFSLGGYDPA